MPKTILVAESPKKITVFDKLPILGGKPTQVNVEDFISEAKQHGNTLEEWSESVSYDTEKKFEYIPKKSDRTLTPEILKQCASNYAKLGICYINEKVSYGVIALEDLEENQPIAVYAGPSKIFSEREFAQFTKSLKKNENGPNLPGYKLTLGYDVNKNRLITDSIKKGNLSRFILHAPNADDPRVRDKYEFKTDYATSNVEGYEYLDGDNQPIDILVTTKRIEKDTMVFWNYGDDYWRAYQIDPCFFDKYGQIISSVNIMKVEIELSPALSVKNFKNSVMPIPKAQFEEMLERGTLTMSAGEKLRETHQKNPFSYFWVEFKGVTLENAGAYVKETLKYITGEEFLYDATNKTAYGYVAHEMADYLKKQGLIFSTITESNPKIEDNPMARRIGFFSCLVPEGQPRLQIIIDFKENSLEKLDNIMQPMLTELNDHKPSIMI